jgi:hypothetical protein
MSKIAVSLFDYTGVMLAPWCAAGYECYAVDLQHNCVEKNGIRCISYNLLHPWLPPFPREAVEIVFAFPPCDHLAVSGARWFKGKGLRKLADSVHLFATAAEFCEWTQAPYMIENPVSTMSTYWRKPDYMFNPCDYTGFCRDDNYTKKTCLWTGGGFVMPGLCKAAGIGSPDSRIHKMPPSTDRANLRSITPAGFARAVFKANATHTAN